MKTFATTTTALLLASALSGCFCSSDDEVQIVEPKEVVAEVPKYIPLTIRQRIHGMVYVKADNYGFQFMHNEESGDLTASKYLFGDVDELPIRALSNIPVKVLTQKSNGTWLLEIDGSKYLINETNLRIWTDTREVLFPERIVIVTEEDIKTKEKEDYEKALQTYKDSLENKKEGEAKEAETKEVK